MCQTLPPRGSGRALAAASVNGGRRGVRRSPVYVAPAQARQQSPVSNAFPSEINNLRPRTGQQRPSPPGPQPKTGRREEPSRSRPQTRPASRLSEIELSTCQTQALRGSALAAAAPIKAGRRGRRRAPVSVAPSQQQRVSNVFPFAINDLHREIGQPRPCPRRLQPETGRRKTCPTRDQHPDPRVSRSPHA